MTYRKFIKMLIAPIVALILALIILLINYLITLPESSYTKSKAVKIHFADNITPSHKQIIESFNEIYAGKIEAIPINLPFTKFSTNERKELLARTFRSKNHKLDVFSVDQIWVPRFAKWAEPLDEYFFENDNRKMLEYPLSTCEIDDVLYAVPFYFDIGIMYYKYDEIFKLGGSEFISKLQKGITWKEIIDFSISNHLNGQPIFALPAAPYEGLMCSIIESLKQLEPGINTENEINFSEESFAHTLKFYHDLVYKYKIVDISAVNKKETESYNDFTNGKALFLRGWPGLGNSSSEIANNQNIKKCLLPRISGKINYSVFGGWNVMLSKYSTHKRESIIFIKYLVSHASQKVLSEFGGRLPILNEFYSKDVKSNIISDINFYSNIYKFGIFRPFINNYTKISDVISLNFNSYLKNEIDLEEALKNSINITVKQ